MCQMIKAKTIIAMLLRGMASQAMQSILFLAPHDDWAAFAATGTLAALLERLPQARIEIVCSPEQQKFYAPFYSPMAKAAPEHLRQVRFHLQNADAGRLARLALALKLSGRFWHRVVALRTGLLPSLLWARHRHIMPLAAAAYQSYDALAPTQICPPAIFVSEKQYLPLPQNLHPATPLIILACGEAARSNWQAKDYAELAWRLSQADNVFAQAHYALLAAANAPIAAQIMANLPNGQVSFLPDLPFAKQAALMQRALAVIGSDQLAARLAAACHVPMVVRLDALAQQRPRPYAVFAGNDANALADYLCAEAAKIERKIF